MGGGETRNAISGGIFFSAVIQGRDITVQLPPEISPALSGFPLGTPRSLAATPSCALCLTFWPPAPVAAMTLRHLVLHQRPQWQWLRWAD